MNEGITRTKLMKTFVTESGHQFEQADVAYKTWGQLNKKRDNVILIYHALTGHAAADEWFPGIFGKNKICDPSENFIICINVPGSCYGSVGPWTEDPATGELFRGNFPDITIRDMVRFQQLLLDQLMINGIRLIIGGSLGGMQALEFCIMDSRVQSAVLIAMGASHSPWAIGISHAQRKAIYADKYWNNGFYSPSDPPSSGLEAARMMAMITYRTSLNYEKRFGRNLQPEKDQFQVESYLDYQGKKLAQRFDALAYVILSKAMDTHDISRGRNSARRILGNINIPVVVAGITSDLLYPVEEQKQLASLLGNSSYSEITSDYGHDAFLIEFDQINEIVQTELTDKIRTS